MCRGVKLRRVLLYTSKYDVYTFMHLQQFCEENEKYEWYGIVDKRVTCHICRRGSETLSSTAWSQLDGWSHLNLLEWILSMSPDEIIQQFSKNNTRKVCFVCLGKEYREVMIDIQWRVYWCCVEFTLKRIWLWSRWNCNGMTNHWEWAGRVLLR